MEWCEAFYDTWKDERYIRRIYEILIVFFAFVAVAICVFSNEQERTAVPAGEIRNTGIEETTGLLATGTDDFEYEKITAMSEYFDTVPDIGQPKDTVDKNMTVDTEIPEIQLEIQSEKITVDNTVTQPEEMVSQKPVIKPEEMVSEQPAAKPENLAPAVPEKTPDNVIIEQPQEEVDDGISSDSTAETSGGFLINEYGIIYGISNDAQVVVDGCLEIPASGCSGISAGAFLEAPAGIREIYISSNITYIEEGAFQGLSEMEWFEMEASGEYYTEDGVLFSENGSCILGFPTARQGTYRVPEQVTRFAQDAFNGAKVDAVDAVKAVVEDIGNFPQSITLVLDEKQTDS